MALIGFCLHVKSCYLATANKELQFAFLKLRHQFGYTRRSALKDIYSVQCSNSEVMLHVKLRTVLAKLNASKNKISKFSPQNSAWYCYNNVSDKEIDKRIYRK